jgi:drug/metabolite transporter (DMT)-like permease
MNEILKGPVWMVGGVFSLTLMAIAGKEISLEIDTFEILFFRSVIGIVIILFVIAGKGLFYEINVNQIRTHFKRNIAHFIGQNLWLYALGTITLAEVTSLEFTMPIWIIFFSFFMLNEKLNKYRIISIGVGFIGVLIIVRPDIGSFKLGLVAAGFSAIAFALTNIYTRRLTQTESTLAIIFFLTSMQLIFGLLTSFIDGRLDLPSAETIPWIVVLGLGGLAAHYCITTALTYAAPSLLAPIDLFRLPLAVLIGIIFYSESGDIYIYIGSLLIVIANWLNLKKTHPENDEPPKDE